MNKIFSSYNKLILINEVSFIGDSIIFFWPLVNAFSNTFPDKQICVFHPHYKRLKPLNENVTNQSLDEFYAQKLVDESSVIIAFIKSDGQMKEFLKSMGLQSIVKGMVGMDFITFNLLETVASENEYEQFIIDNTEIKYLFKNRETDSHSGFPLLKNPFSNVYEYAKILNESFFGLETMYSELQENIIINEVKSKESFADLFIPPSPAHSRKFILINLICGTYKQDVEEKYAYLLNWIKKVSSDAENEGLDVFLSADNMFPKLRSDLLHCSMNLYFLKEGSSLYWNALIKKASKVYSIDTGFLHISHVLNKNTYGFGGDVDFWFFKDKIIRIEDFKL